MDLQSWGTPLLAALLGLIIAYATGKKNEAAEQDARWTRLNNRLEEFQKAIAKEISEIEYDLQKTTVTVQATDQEMKLRLLAIEKDIETLARDSKTFVSAYELERRAELWASKKDELRRRIISLERAVFTYDLDGAVGERTSITVPRSDKA